MTAWLPAAGAAVALVLAIVGGVWSVSHQFGMLRAEVAALRAVVSDFGRRLEAHIVEERTWYREP